MKRKPTTSYKKRLYKICEIYAVGFVIGVVVVSGFDNILDEIPSILIVIFLGISVALIVDEIL